MSKVCVGLLSSSNNHSLRIEIDNPVVMRTHLLIWIQRKVLEGVNKLFHKSIWVLATDNLHY
jgi:hypothetical protein